MHKKLLIALSFPLLAGASFSLATKPAAAATVCDSTGQGPCDSVINIFNTSSGLSATVTYTGPSAYNQGYALGDDVLLGVTNSSNVAIGRIGLSGSDIFGFEGDGICGAAAGICSTQDGNQYAGPNTSFSITDPDNGFVNFTGGLAPGQSAFFSLEGPLSQVTVGNITPATAVPEPISGWDGLVVGGIGLSWLMRKKIASARQRTQFLG